MLRYLQVKVKATINNSIINRWLSEGSYFRDKLTIEKLSFMMNNGSLLHLSERPIIRKCVIARRLGVKLPTVSTVLRRWRMSGIGAAYFDRLKNKKSPWIARKIVEAIVQQKLVDQMVQFSLPEWLPIIRKSLASQSWQSPLFERFICRMA